MTTLSDLLREDTRERVVLVEIDYIAEVAGEPALQTLYFSSSDKTTQGRVDLFTEGSPGGGTPLLYEDCINSVPSFSRSLSGPVSSTFTSSLGSIEIDNADGDKDYILGLALDGSQARFYIWVKGTKFLVFTALCLRTTVPSIDRISIALKDASVLLNKSVGGTDVIGGTGPNADQWRPINFGYVHNLDAKVLDASALTYVHSDTGTFTAAADVRDRGVSVTYTDNADGTFTLDASPAGIITCDVVSSYDGTDPTRRVSDFMQFLIGDRQANNQGQGFDGAGSTYTIGDDDDYLIGISIPEARNIVDVLNDVVDSGNCFWAIKRTGEFFYGRLRPNNIEDFGFVTATIYDDDWDNGSWKIDHDAPLYYLLQAYMSRNWYQQTDFAGALTPDEQAVFTRPGIFLLQETAVGTAYADIPEAYDKTLSISPAIDTLLSGGFDELDLPYLAAWMETRRFMQLPWIERLSITVGLEFYFLELGDPVQIVTPRYGLDSGDLFQVIQIDINLTQSKINLVVLRRHEAEPLPPGWTRVTASIDAPRPPLALKAFISIPPGPGTGSPNPPCGWLYSPTRGWYFVPCGGGGGPVTDNYNFRAIGGSNEGGGTFAADWPVASGFFDSDQFHTPVWYDISDPNILIHEDVADDANANTGATVDVPYLSDASHPFRSGYTTPDFINLPYPATLNDTGATGITILFNDASTKLADGSIIDYTVNVDFVTGLRFIVPAGPYSPGTDIVAGQMQGQYWVDHDYGYGTATSNAVVVVDASILGGMPIAYTFANAQLLLTIQNNSGATITDFDDGVGGLVEINVPSNAVDPDAPADGELDVSFTGGAPTCTINNASGATLTVSGDRRTLQFKFTGASIADGERVSFVFPLTITKGGDDGWLGFSQTGDDQARPVPTFNGNFDTNPSATIKLIGGSQSVGFLPND